MVNFELHSNGGYEEGGKALENIFPTMFACKADAVVNMYVQKARILVIIT